MIDGGARKTTHRNTHTRAVLNYFALKKTYVTLEHKASQETFNTVTHLLFIFILTHVCVFVSYGHLHYLFDCDKILVSCCAHPPVTVLGGRKIGDF